MKTRDDIDGLLGLAKEQTVGKMIQLGPSNIRINHWKAMGRLRYPLNLVVEFIEKPSAQAWNFVFVPVICAGDFLASDSRYYRYRYHLLRSANSARNCSHVMADKASLSKLSRRR